MQFREKLSIASKSIFCLLLIIFQVSCSNKKDTKESYLRTVRIITPEIMGDTVSESYWGTVEEGKNVNASFMADGKIKNLYVKEGDRVRKGQLLASLDDSDYEIGVKQLKAQFNQMTEEKKRMDEMFARHNIAPNDYEKFTAGYEQLKLQMQMAENKLGYTKLYSPSDGYVAEKFIEPGELVGAGTPVFKITDDSNLVAEVDMPVNVYLDRKNIQSVTGFSPALKDETIPLKIESFTPDPSNNMLYKLKLLIPSNFSGKLSSGMNLKINIKTLETKGKGIKLQSRSVFNDDGKKYVWIYNPNDSTISKKEIRVIGSPEGQNLIVAGLDGSEEVVETGVKQLYEGEKVLVSNNADFGL